MRGLCCVLILNTVAVIKCKWLILHFFAVHVRYFWHDSLCSNTNRRNAYNQLLAVSIYDATLSISMLLHTGMALASEAHINSRAQLAALSRSTVPISDCSTVCATKTRLLQYTATNLTQPYDYKTINYHLRTVTIFLTFDWIPRQTVIVKTEFVMNTRLVTQTAMLEL